METYMLQSGEVVGRSPARVFFSRRDAVVSRKGRFDAPRAVVRNVPAGYSTPMETSEHDAPLPPATTSAIVQHPLYDVLHTPAAWRVFMEHHIFAVWDFMSLVKRLQRDLCWVDIPWQPRPHPHLSRFINEVVLAEESDDDGQGGYASHFQIYVQAMEDCGANTTAVRRFTTELQRGITPLVALRNAGAPPAAIAFVAHTLEVALHGTTAEVCAVFFWAREDLIPRMFTPLLQALESSGHRIDRLGYYLQRHIALDATDHGPLAERALDTLCAHSPTTRLAAQHAAARALKTRTHFWDRIWDQVSHGLSLQTSAGNDLPQK